MATINSYLNFMGQTEEAFNFYKAAFGGDFVMIQRFKDTPDGANLSAEDKEKIMHIALPIGKNLLMGTDCLDAMGQSLNFGNNMSISVDAESLDEAEHLFNALSADGKIGMPLGKQFWGAYFGYFFDKFGVQWMINYQFEQPQ